MKSQSEEGIEELVKAIQKGVRLRPKACGDFFAATEKGKIGSCVLGAALEGEKGKIADEDTKILAKKIGGDTVMELFGLEWVEAVNPVTGGYAQSLWIVMSDLNDDHNWSRQRIAKWVEENADEFEY